MTMLVCCYSPPIPIRSFTDIAAPIFELQQAHAYMIKTKLINDTFAASRLVAFAATNSDLPTIAYAHSIFSRIKYPNAYIWNVMIRAYANSPDPVHALLIFNQMLHSCGVVPDKYTYPFVLKACSGVGGLGEGRQVHGHAVKRGIKADIYVYNSLISMYARSGCFDIARKLLDKMLLRDVISWNALLSGYVDKGLMGSAQQLFDEMEERNAESWNFLISGYVKAGLIEEARKLFDEMNVKNVVSWNSLMTGYAHASHFHEVLLLFQDMRSQKVKPDICTFVNVLSACAHVGALTQGEWVHSYIDKHGIIVEGFLATALVDMYSKCGNIKKALKVFRSSSRRKDVSTWNSVISGLSLHGFGEMAIEFFEKMLADGYKPNEVTFISVLSACSRSGLLNEGHRLFNLMIHVHKIQPTVEHFGCMVDLLGRFGLVEEAEEFLRMTPVQEEPALWESLLASCTNYGNVELAQTVAEKLLELNSRDSAGYVQLSNMYASMGKWRNVSEVRKKMKACGVKKEPGCSLIEIDGVVHEFLAGEGLIS